MNTIDELRAKDPEGLTKEDVSDVIAYVRGLLRQYELGVKPKRGEGPKVEFEGLGLAKPGYAIKRRKLV